MIKSVRLQNFESHKDTTIRLAKGTTGILGDSEHGKSAIFRAVQWVVFNRHVGPKPTGDNYRSVWGGPTRVTITFDDDKQVIRQKGKSNKYIIIIKGKKKVLSGFGMQVPKEVADLLGMYTLNFQNQHDAAYLLPPTSSGEVARKLNEIVDLSIIDTTQININAMVRKSKRLLVDAENELKESREQKKKLAWIKDAKQNFALLKKQRDELEQCRTKEQKINKILWEVRQNKKETSAIINIEAAGKGIQELEKQAAIIKQTKEKNNRIIAILKDIRTAGKLLREAKEESEKIEKEYNKKFPERCPLCGTKIKKRT